MKSAATSVSDTLTLAVPLFSFREFSTLNTHFSNGLSSILMILLFRKFLIELIAVLIISKSVIKRGAYMLSLKFSIFALSILLVLTLGCSSRNLNQITLPDNNSDSAFSIPLGSSLPDGHSPLGFWNLSFDPSTLNVEVTQDRNLSAHYNLTSSLTPSIILNSYNPTTGILDVDVKINNTYPINGYDLRLIIFTDAAGHFLENWDDFTNLYDIGGGNIINPFKAYAKAETNRKFAAYTQHTENLKLYIPAGDFSVKLAIDACFPSNCTEPYSIDNFTQGTLKETTGSSAPVSVDVSDWQNNVSAVYLYCPFITGGPLVTMSHGSGNTWSGTLTNNAGIGFGQYTGYIAAFSGADALYDLIVIQISKAQQQFSDVFTFGGTNYDMFNSSASDPANNLYLAGYFYDTVDFDPGPGVVQRTSMGQIDSYLLKLDRDGQFQWVQVIANATDVVPWFTYIDRGQYVYLLGTFNSSCDFNPGPGEDLHTSAGFYDVYVSKYDLSGNWIWTKTYGGNNFDQALCLATDSSGNIYISGYFAGTIDFDPGPGSYEATSKGYQDNYVTKLDSNGNLQWAKVFGSTTGETPYNIYIKDNSSVVVAGKFESMIDFDPGTGVQNRIPAGENAIYILNLDLNGNYIDVQVFGGDQTCYIYAMAYHPLYGYLISGEFSGTMDFDPGTGVDTRTSDEQYNTFICRYDPALDYQWVRTFGNPDGSIYMEGLQYAASGGIVAGGSYSGHVDCDPGVNEYWLEMTSEFDSNAVMFKLDINGNFEWANTWGGSGVDTVRDLNCMTDDSIFAVGDFWQTADFDPGSGVVNRTSNGQNDTFISVFE
jgi:hypothetical protein